MAEDIGEKLRPVLEPALRPGEELQGVLVASQQSALRGRMVGIGVTADRLLIQPLTRKFEPSEKAISLTPDQIADAKATGAGDEWFNVTAAVMDGSAVTLRLKTTDGEKLKLMMMRGEGVLGRLGGGETQRQGIEALAGWFAANA
jgi:hypothetical protein